ncbi:MAG: hypothetical protein ACFFFC_18535, partial [Candidatus Thorarchaeota archaeon]
SGILISPILLYTAGTLWMFSLSVILSPLVILSAAIILLFRNRINARMALESHLGTRWKQIVAAILVVNLVSLAMVFHAVSYSGNLYWGIEEGDQFSYSVESTSEYYGGEFLDYYLLELNNSIIVFTIESLPEIPLYCDSRAFCESLVNHVKASAVYENGSSISPDIENDAKSLFSHALLPIGDWNYIDRLFYDSPRGGFGSRVQDPWFSKSYGDYLLFGWISIGCTGAPGWDADVSYENGVPLIIRTYPISWGGGTSTLTRILD